MFITFKTIFSLLFRLSEFYWSVLKFSDSVFCNRHSIAMLNQQGLFFLFLFCVIIFFSSIISLQSFSLWLISLLRLFNFFICFKAIHNYYWSSIMLAALKSVKYLEQLILLILSWVNFIFSFKLWSSWCFVWQMIFYTWTYWVLLEDT